MTLEEINYAWWSSNPISLSAQYRAFIEDLIRNAQREAGDRP